MDLLLVITIDLSPISVGVKKPSIWFFLHLGYCLYQIEMRGLPAVIDLVCGTGVTPDVVFVVTVFTLVVKVVFGGYLEGDVIIDFVSGTVRIEGTVGDDE